MDLFCPSLQMGIYIFIGFLCLNQLPFPDNGFNQGFKSMTYYQIIQIGIYLKNVKFLRSKLGNQMMKEKNMVKKNLVFFIISFELDFLFFLIKVVYCLPIASRLEIRMCGVGFITFNILICIKVLPKKRQMIDFLHE